MKAVFYTTYGAPQVLKIKEIPKPIPKDDEVLIKLAATSVTSADSRLRALRVPKGLKFIVRLFLGFNKPKKQILGNNFSGIIEDRGKQVTKYKTGDLVFGTTGANFGTYAEYISISENSVISSLPYDMSFEEATVLPFGALTALHTLKELNLNETQKILINGASGAVGTATIQLAKYYGVNVTGICSTTNIDLVKSLGADHVIDYTKEDYSKLDNTYDYVIDTIGNISFKECKRVLKQKGKLLYIAAGLPQFFQMFWTSLFSRIKVKCIFSREARTEDIIFLKELVEEKKLIAVVDRTYPLTKIAEAHKYVDTGRKKGNVVIKVNLT